MQLLGRSHRGRSPPPLTQSGLLASRVEETERTAANLWKPSRTAKLAVAKLLKRMIKRIHLDVFWLLFKLKLAFFPNRILHLPTLCVCVCGEERMRFVIVALAARHSDGSSCWCAAYVGLCDRVGGFNRTSSCSGRGLEEFAAFRRIQKEIPYAPATGIPAWYLVTSRESRACVNLDSSKSLQSKLTVPQFWSKEQGDFAENFVGPSRHQKFSKVRQLEQCRRVPGQSNNSIRSGKL